MGVALAHQKKKKDVCRMKVGGNCIGAEKK